MTGPALSWIGIVRLGLVQTSLGSIVAITNSTLNRVMVVELALVATLPGLLVALHYAIQMLRPRWGYGSDIGGQRTPWIIGGMGVLAVGGVSAAAATALMATHLSLGIAAAVVAYALIGIGVGACGTNLLALLATRAAPERRASAAAIVWLMMIAGIIVTSMVLGSLIEPFTFSRLITAAAAVAALAVLITVLAVWGLEGAPEERSAPVTVEPAPPFSEAIGQIWAETESRRFAIFVFVAMLAYNAQDLILEPFAGLVFGLTPGETTRLSGVQHQGVFLGMLLVGVLGTLCAASRWGSMRGWTIGGCLASAVALLGLAAVGVAGPLWSLYPAVFALGAANGAFAVAAIGSMMGLAGTGRKSREGTRMGLWGAAQAMAFGLGGLTGTVAVDAARLAIDDPATAYGLVFAAEGLLFLCAALLASRIVRARDPRGMTAGTLSAA